MIKFDKLANISVIVAAIAVCTGVIYDRYGSGPQSRPAVVDLRQRLIGKQLSLPNSSGGKPATAATLVLVGSKTCHFCADSMPFYSRLASLRPRGADDMKVIAAFPAGHETYEETMGLFAAHGVTPDGAEPVNFTAIGVMSTPTVILLDGSGIVKDLWVGKLPESGQNKVIAELVQLCVRCKVSGS
jgi:hypothetical protein